VTRRLLALLVFALLAATLTLAEVKLPALLSDGAVLQRDLPTHFWGMAAPGEKVTVSFRGERKTATSDALGHWSIYLSPSKPGGPFEATITGQNTITIHDIYVGDVWLASGQSNMEFELEKAQDGAAEVARANCPQIHLLQVKRYFAEIPQEDISTTGWHTCSPETIRQFSAVAYYFAKNIQPRIKVPVGIIASYWGGTQAEAWTSLTALTSDAALTPLLAAHARMIGEQNDAVRQQKIEQALVDDAKAKGMPPPKFLWHPDPRMWQPGELFNTMVYPLTPFPIKGVIWYQGESNSIKKRAPYLYNRVFETLIRDWRARWGEGNFPFLFTQISNFTSDDGEDWPAIREGQRHTLELRNTGMAVTIDIGDPEDVHPTNKLDVGNRLALIARATVYGENVEYSGPLFRELTRESNALRIYFDHVGTGLLIKGPVLKSFEVAGADGRFLPAEATIDGNTIVVTNPQISDPISVRYGWANSPDCNLFNREGLPASPFQAVLPPLH
jgi:sialate O-acetylesterase